MEPLKALEAARNALPPTDPNRIIQEAVSLVAEQLSRRVEALPRELLSSLPRLFGLQATHASAAETYARIVLKSNIKEPVWVARNSTVSIESAPSVRMPFVTTAPFLCVPGSAATLDCDLTLEPTSKHLYVRIPHIPQIAKSLGSQWLALYVDVESQTSSPTQVCWSVFDGAQWIALPHKDDTYGLQHSGHMHLDLAHAPQVLTSTPLSENGQHDYWIRLESDERNLDRVRAVRLNVVSLRNQVEYPRLCLGSGTGLPGQRFQLPPGQVLAPLHLVIESGSVEVKWTQVSSFFLSDAGDTHFRHIEHTGEILFGDGRLGRVAPPGFDNIIVRDLRLTMGAAGNVRRSSHISFGKEWDSVDHGMLLQEGRGGCDAASQLSLVSTLHGALHNKDRAVTARDFESIVLRHHPQIGRVFVQGRGASTVHVTPLTTEAHARSHRPIDLTPSPEELNSIRITLNSRRMINCQVEVESPSYQDVELHAQVSFGVLSETTQAEAEACLTRWVLEHATPGMLVRSEDLEAAFLTLPQARAVKSLRFVDTITQVAHHSLLLQRGALPRILPCLRVEEERP